MSDDNIENLPSNNDFFEEKNPEELPSIEEFITEEPITNRSNDPGKQGGFGSGEGQKKRKKKN